MKLTQFIERSPKVEKESIRLSNHPLAPIITFKYAGLSNNYAARGTSSDVICVLTGGVQL